MDILGIGVDTTAGSNTAAARNRPTINKNRLGISNATKKSNLRTP